jgi:hypothetical protein
MCVSLSLTAEGLTPSQRRRETVQPKKKNSNSHFVDPVRRSVTVVNIDNGCGAAFAVARIDR